MLCFKSDFLSNKMHNFSSFGRTTRKKKFFPKAKNQTISYCSASHPEERKPMQRHRKEANAFKNEVRDKRRGKIDR